MSEQANSTTTPATGSEELRAAHIETAPTIPPVAASAAGVEGSSSSTFRARVRETVEDGKTYYTGTCSLRDAASAAELIGPGGKNVFKMKETLMERNGERVRPEITFHNNERRKATGVFSIKSTNRALVLDGLKLIMRQEKENADRIKVLTYGRGENLAPVLGKNFCILRAIEAEHGAQVVLNKMADGTQTLRIASSCRETTIATEATIEDLLHGDLKAPELLARVFDKNAVKVDCPPNIARRMYGKGSFVDLLTEHFRGDIQIYYFSESKPFYWSIRGLTRELVQEAMEAMDVEIDRRKAEVEAIRAARKAAETPTAAEVMEAFADGGDVEGMRKQTTTRPARTVPGYNPHAKRDVKPQALAPATRGGAAAEAIDEDVEIRVEGRRAYRPRKEDEKKKKETPAELAAKLAAQAEENAKKYESSSRRDSVSTTSSRASDKLAEAATTTTEPEGSSDGPAAGGGGAAGGGASTWAAIAAKPGVGGAKPASSGAAAGGGGSRSGGDSFEDIEFTEDDLDDLEDRKDLKDLEDREDREDR
jgi:hypothetical protein